MVMFLWSCSWYSFVFAGNPLVHILMKSEPPGPPFTGQGLDNCGGRKHLPFVTRPGFCFWLVTHFLALIFFHCFVYLSIHRVWVLQTKVFSNVFFSRMRRLCCLIWFPPHLEFPSTQFRSPFRGFFNLEMVSKDACFGVRSAPRADAFVGSADFYTHARDQDHQIKSSCVTFE